MLRVILIINCENSKKQKRRHKLLPGLSNPAALSLRASFGTGAASPTYPVTVPLVEARCSATGPQGLCPARAHDGFNTLSLQSVTPRRRRGR